MSAINRYVFLAAAAVHSCAGLELEMKFPMPKKLREWKSKFMAEEPVFVDSVKERMDWEASTLKASNLMRAKGFGGGFSLTDKERDAVATIAIVTALAQERRSWPAKDAPKHPKHWDNSFKHKFKQGLNLKLFSKTSHCRYSGRVVPRGEIDETINGVKLHADVVTNFLNIDKVKDTFPRYGNRYDIMFTKIKQPQDVVLNLKKVLAVDEQCDSPACRSLMKKFIEHDKQNYVCIDWEQFHHSELGTVRKPIELKKTSEEYEALKVLANKSPFYHFYSSLANKKHDAIVDPEHTDVIAQFSQELKKRFEENKLQGEFLFRVQDLDMNFENIERSIGANIDGSASGEKKTKAKNGLSTAFKVGQHGFIVVDTRADASKALKIGCPFFGKVTWWNAASQTPKTKQQSQVATSFVQSQDAGSATSLVQIVSLPEKLLQKFQVIIGFASLVAVSIFSFTTFKLIPLGAVLMFVAGIYFAAFFGN